MSAYRLECTAREYLADPCPISLNVSTARLLISRSPLHAWAQHPRLGGVLREPTPAMLEGSIMHAILLGQTRELAVLDYEHYRTREAQITRDEAIAQGLIPVLRARYDELGVAANAIRDRLAEKGVVLAGGIAEEAITWIEQPGDVRCRARLDYVVIDDDNGRVTCYDLKTITAADRRTCTLHADRYGYHLQHAAYTSALRALYPKHAIDFVFLFVELEPPYGVAVMRPSASSIDIGMRQWRRALLAWSYCLARNEWPGYEDGELEPSAGLIAHEDGISDAELIESVAE